MFAENLKFFIEGLGLGLTVGVTCMVFCLPVIIGLASRSINKINPIFNFSFFVLGRFFAYLLIAVTFSIIGIKLKEYSNFDFLLKFAVAILLILWGIKGFINIDNENKICPVKNLKKPIPFFAGVLTGLSPCAPFAAGVTRVISIGNILTGVIYFFGFFISTSIFILPGLSIGLVKYKKELKIIVSLISILFGIFFLFNSIFEGSKIWM